MCWARRMITIFENNNQKRWTVTHPPPVSQCVLSYREVTVLSQKCTFTLNTSPRFDLWVLLSGSDTLHCLIIHRVILLSHQLQCTLHCTHCQPPTQLNCRRRVMEDLPPNSLSLWQSSHRGNQSESLRCCTTRTFYSDDSESPARRMITISQIPILW